MLYICLDLHVDPIFLWAIYVCVLLAFMYSALHISEYLLRFMQKIRGPLVGRKFYGNACRGPLHLLKSDFLISAQFRSLRAFNSFL